MKQNIKSYALICALSGLVAAGPAAAQSVQAKVTTSPTRQLTPQEQEALSVVAVRVLRHIADARGANHDQNLDRAKEDLGKAMKSSDKAIHKEAKALKADLDELEAKLAGKN